MLKIRSEQIERLQVDRDTRFARVLAKKLRALWRAEAEALGERELHSRCLDCIADARTFGLHHDRSIMRLANLRFALGQRFPDPDLQPGLAGILGDTSRSEPDRLNALWAAVVTHRAAQSGPPGPKDT